MQQGDVVDLIRGITRAHEREVADLLVALHDALRLVEDVAHPLHNPVSEAYGITPERWEDMRQRAFQAKNAVKPRLEGVLRRFGPFQ